MLLAALQASTQNSRRTNIKWLKNEGPTKIVSSSVTENRTGTLGLNINFRPRIEWWLAVAHSTGSGQLQQTRLPEVIADGRTRLGRDWTFSSQANRTH